MVRGWQAVGTVAPAIPFSITPTPPTSIKLEPGREGRFSFTVTSQAAPDTARPVILQALLVASNGRGEEVDWLVVGPQRSSIIAGGETKTVTITVSPPADSPPGQHKIKLVVADRDRPNDVFADSPPVVCEITAPLDGAGRRPAKRPWWLIPAIAGGLVMTVGGALLVWRLVREPPAPGERIAIRVRPMAPGQALPTARLVVAFFQLDDDLTVRGERPPVRIGYDAPFVARDQPIELPLDEIQLPAPIEHYQLCAHPCKDLLNPACACRTTEARAAVALVFIVVDADGSGRIEPEELISSNIAGTGFFVLAFADRAIPVPNPDELVFRVFSEGIVKGLAPYRIIHPQQGFDRLGLPIPGAVFQLDVCVPRDASCAQRRSPNLT